ncbi:MAG TPA: T9SS type A sorting domain-containing protein [Saprospiraceae bacterium]|nr:T9SS type A sorting domain-containing protein [Saprospiraceae bacterium]
MLCIYKYRILFFSCLVLISVLDANAQPANDDPCGALQLSIEAGSQCIPAGPISWNDATATSGFPNPGCADYDTGDIWFKFTITSTSDIFITSLEGNGANAITDGGMAVYYNNQDCDDTFYYIACDDDAGQGSMPEIELPAQAAGTYYIRYWDYDDKTSGDIEGLCVAANPVTTNAQNDDPCDAMILNVINGDDCTPSSPLSWTNASATAGLDIPTCGNYRSGDIWFSFHLTDTSDVFISTTEGAGAGAILDGGLSVYSADECEGTFTEIYCANDQGADLMPKLVVPIQLPGQYYIRFWDIDDNTSGNIGGICVAAEPSVSSQIQNDDPCGAIELPVVSGATCIPDNPQFWSDATATDGVDDPPCASYTTGDVWFKFSLSEASDIFITTVEGTGTNTFKDAAMALYKADACDGDLIFIFCDDDAGPGTMPQIEQIAMPVGEYYIRVWDYDDRVTGNIGGICVSALPTISTSPNDICITALPFPEIPTDGSCSTVSVNTDGATGIDIDVCDGIADDDVWYSFVVPDGITQIGFEITAHGEPFKEIIRLNRGNCDNQLFVACYNSNQGIFPDLNEGQTYFIRTFTAADDTAAQYDICLRALTPPSNDDPCGAITLVPVNNATDCVADNPVAWEFASSSSIVSEPECGSYQTGDVWFKFEITYKADIVVKTSAGTGGYGITDGAMTLYKKVSDCNQLDQIACNDDASESNLMPLINEFNLSPGTYYVRFWDYHDMISGNIGGICVAVTPTISTKENDQCGSALPFPVIPVNGTCSTVHINNNGATGSLNAPLPGYNDDDLWYSFIVPQGVDRLLYEITTNYGNTQHIICLYDGCGSHASYSCSEFPFKETGEFTNLIEGYTYIISVYTADLGVTSDYNVCLKTPPPAPSNDECNGSIAFPSIPPDGTCSTVSVNTTWATSSGIFDCDQVAGDLWYTFVVPDGITELLADFTSDGINKNEGFEVFKGDCDTLISTHCLSDYVFQSLRLRGLLPGETYYVRAFTDDAKLFVFDLCLKVPPQAPVNDLCPDAIAFPDIPTDGSCATMIANTFGASGDILGSSSLIPDDDVWFNFVIPQGHSGIIVETTPVTMNIPLGVSIYGGDCGQLIFIGDQNDKPAAFYGLNEGETYFAKAYTLLANVEATFEICISVAPSSPDNDGCDEAQAFPSIPQNGNWVSVEGSTLSGTDSGLKACGGYGEDDVWLNFVVPGGHDRLLFRHNFDNDLVFELFEGDCGDLNFLECFIGSNSSGVFKDLAEGDTYFIRVYNSTQFEFSSYMVELSVPAPLTNDLCDQAIVFPPIPDGPVGIALFANTALASTSDLPSCIGSTDDDVWFKFIAPDQHTSVLFDLDIEYGSVLGMQVFKGSCDDLVLQECFDFPTFDDISGLVPGDTYWIQVYTLDLGSAAEFSLALFAGPLPPVNDDCSDATSITGTPGLFVDPGLQTTAGATNSGERLCYPFDGNSPGYAYDVWYSFVADHDGGDATVTISFNEPSLGTYEYLNFNVQGFEGQCGEFNSMACLQNDFSINGFVDSTIVMNLYGLGPNTTYYFRVFSVTGSRNYAPVDFTIFAEGTALSPTVGNEDVKPDDGLSINRFYPSPANNLLNIDFTANTQSKADIYVTDLLGHVILQKEIVTKQGQNHETLHFDQIPSGLYFFYIENNKERSQPKRFVIE